MGFKKSILCFFVLPVSLLFIKCKEGNKKENARQFYEQRQAEENKITKLVPASSFGMNTQIDFSSLHAGGSYASVFVFDTFLLCTTIRDSMAVHVFSTRSHAKLGAIIKVGDGRGECLNVYSIFSARQNTDPVFWFYDFNQKKIDGINIIRALRHQPDFLVSEVKLTDSLVHMNAPLLTSDSNRYVACSYAMTDCRYFYFTLTHSSITKAGSLPAAKPEWPTDTYHNGKLNFLARTFNGKLIANPSTAKQFAIAYKTTDRIDLYRNDRLYKIIRGPDHFDPDKKFTREQDILLSREYEKTRFAFVDAIADGPYFYALYSGQAGFKAYGNRLFVFDWEGNPEKSYSTSVEVSSFAFANNKKQRQVFAVDPISRGIVWANMPD